MCSPGSVAAFDNEQKVDGVYELSFGKVEVEVAGSCHKLAVCYVKVELWHTDSMAVGCLVCNAW